MIILIKKKEIKIFNVSEHFTVEFYMYLFIIFNNSFTPKTIVIIKKTFYIKNIKYIFGNNTIFFPIKRF